MSAATIQRMGQQGDGVAESGGAVLHLSGTLPGERVEVEEGGALRILAASPERVTPFCPVHDRCGGCKLQHWAEQPYAKWKAGLLVQALAGRGLETPVMPLIDAQGEGRRRVVLHVRQVEGQWAAGFMAAKSHALCAIAECPVLVPRLRRVPLAAAELGAILGPCDVSVTAVDNGLDMAVKAERKAVPRRLEALQFFAMRWDLSRLAVNGESLLAQRHPVVAVGAAQVPLPVGSFLQATQAGEEALASLVLEGLGDCKSAADLFCGVGPFALRLARATQVEAWDSDRAAVAALQKAARNTQGLKPVTAAVRNLFRAPLVSAELKGFDGVVFDPPRAGAEAQARELAKSNVKRVVAVACDVQSFARDAALLVAGGYKLMKAVPVDQFKWTAHLEMVGVFVR